MSLFCSLHDLTGEIYVCFIKKYFKCTEDTFHRKTEEKKHQFIEFEFQRKKYFTQYYSSNYE